MKNISSYRLDQIQKIENRIQTNRKQKDLYNTFKQNIDNNLANINSLNWKPSYTQVGWIIDNLPFRTNPTYKGYIAKQIHRISFNKFLEIVLNSCKARNPERYFMKSLTDIKDQHQGGAPNAGPNIIITETRGVI